MNANFEQEFSEIQSDIVAICLEYIEDKGDMIYIYLSCEGRMITEDFFYKIDGKFFYRHKLPVGYDCSFERQKECLEIIREDIIDLKKLCLDNSVEMPTDIRLIYDIKNNRLRADYKYENMYLDCGKSPSEIFNEWYQEVCNSN